MHTLPVLVVTAEYDPLREKDEFRRREVKDSTLTHDDGANHGFIFWVDVVDRRAAMERISCGMAVVTNSSTMTRYPRAAALSRASHAASASAPHGSTADEGRS